MSDGKSTADQMRERNANLPVIHPDMTEAADASEAGQQLARPERPGAVDMLVNAMEAAPSLADAVALNEADGRTYVRGVLPWTGKYELRPWDDYDNAHLVAMLQSAGLKFRRDDVADALKKRAYALRFDPLKDLIDGLPAWDGQERAGHLLAWYLGAEAGEYERDVEHLFFDAIVRRVYEPGVKFDCMMVLQGPQGIGKSTWLRYAAVDDAFFTDDVGAFGKRDFAESIQGKLVVEIGELSALGRADLECVKATVSRTVDTYRAPYGKFATDHPRRCVLAGTTNATAYLSDQTGNRRFLPIRCGAHAPTRSLFENEADARRDFAQALAEAAHTYRAGEAREKLLLGTEALAGARAAQQGAQQDDSRVGVIGEWLANTAYERVCARQLCVEALRIEQPKQYEVNEVREIMEREFSADWPLNPKRQRCESYGRQYAFERRAGGR